MNTLLPRSPEVETAFTGAPLTGFGGWSVPGLAAARPSLPRALSSVCRIRLSRPF
ncbi:MAG: hypothetical protein OXC93_14150 [Rhodospirillaceae bacterium]|nr:hypothetical protein [Rhodospirillaceae bacterium]